MRYFDLHCDTITNCLDNNKKLAENDLHISLEKVRRIKNLESYIQCFAAFVPDSMEGEEAFSYFLKAADKFDLELSKNKNEILLCRMLGDIGKTVSNQKYGGILTVENGKALGGRLENIEIMKERGVKILSLTWNAQNELGGGAFAKGDIGLTDFGRKAVPMLEKAGIVIDLSHASDKLFYDTAKIAGKPFIASHSNARHICSHPRNLTDEQILLICQSGGIIGLNFYRAFLNQDENAAAMEDIIRHADHILSLGCENALAIGGDLDGAELPGDMRDVAAIEDLYELFLSRNYEQSLADKIFYKNAERFFAENNFL